MDRYLMRSPDDESSSSKRIKLTNLDSHSSSQSQPSALNTKGYSATEICMYGDKCYRRNIHHFKEFRHPHCKKYFKTLQDQSKLERLLEEMTATNNLDELPDNFITKDKDIVLDQVKKLKAAGFLVKLKTEVSSPKIKPSGFETLKKKQDQEGSSRTQLLSKPNFELDPTHEPIQKPVLACEKLDQELKVKHPSNWLDPLEKWKASIPFNMFLTSIGPEKTYFSMGFKDLFYKSFGKIKSICHINFMVEMEWLMEQMIMSGTSGIPTLIIYGTENPDVFEASKSYSWISSNRMKSPHAFGHHHSKMTLIEYEDSSVRFIVYTANLIESDWMNKTQGMWVSPACAPLQNKNDEKTGESLTNFRSDMINYLITYQLKDLENWLKVIGNSDCSEIKVVLVASAPVLSQSISNNGFRWGLKKVQTVLKKHLTAPIDSQWPIIAQCSSVGSLGPDDSWLKNEWGALLDGPVKTKPPIKFVYPSYKDVVNSAQGEEGADCLPYGNMVHCKQKWIESIMCNWIGFRYNRTYALPHIKTYCRVSPDNMQMAWYILTSANLSKAAWGKLNKKQDSLIVMSWECGVMFIPKLLTGTPTFKGEITEIDNGSRASSRLALDRQTVGYPFPVPYDLPVTPYSGASKPWLVDYLNRSRRGRPS